MKTKQKKKREDLILHLNLQRLCVNGEKNKRTIIMAFGDDMNSLLPSYPHNSFLLTICWRNTDNYDFSLTSVSFKFFFSTWVLLNKELTVAGRRFLGHLWLHKTHFGWYVMRSGRHLCNGVQWLHVRISESERERKLKQLFVRRELSEFRVLEHFPLTANFQSSVSQNASQMLVCRRLQI